MKRVGAIILVFLLLILLAALRFFQEEFFYDPLIDFFYGDYLTAESLPEINLGKLLLATSGRFWLNSSISLLILKVVFKKAEILKISILIYGALFVVLIIAFTYLIADYEQNYNLALFYIRRFLIQPVMLLLLLPAFYYQKLRNK